MDVDGNKIPGFLEYLQIKINKLFHQQMKNFQVDSYLNIDDSFLI